MDQVSAEQQTKGDDHKLIPLNVVDLVPMRRGKFARRKVNRYPEA